MTVSMHSAAFSIQSVAISTRNASILMQKGGACPFRYIMQEFRYRVPQFRYRVRRRDVLQKEDASPRRKETRPHEGKKTAYNAGLLGEKDGEDALRRPESTAEGGAFGGAEPWAPGWPSRPRSPPGSKVVLQCSERGRSGSLWA